MNNLDTAPATVDWQTPPELFAALDKEFGFTLDAAATKRSALCRKYFSKEHDGLAANWAGEIVFCHPPQENIAAWVKKCAVEGAKPDTAVVLLAPAKTDARYFHADILPKSRIRWLQGRMILQDPDGNTLGRPAVGSLLAIYRGPLTKGIKPVMVDILQCSTLTSGELHAMLRRRGYDQRINSITSRLSQLERAERIHHVGKRICRETRNMATVWAAMGV